MLDLQGGFNKQLSGCGRSLSDRNMNYLVFSKEFLVFNKVSKYGNINFAAFFFVWEDISPPKTACFATCTKLQAFLYFTCGLIRYDTFLNMYLTIWWLRCLMSKCSHSLFVSSSNEKQGWFQDVLNEVAKHNQEPNRREAWGNQKILSDINTTLKVRKHKFQALVQYYVP